MVVFIKRDSVPSARYSSVCNCERSELSGLFNARIFYIIIYNYICLYIYTVNVEIFDVRKFRALWTGPIIFNFRAH